MSIWNELIETQRIVSEAERIQQPFVAKPRSTIRERALLKTLDRLEAGFLQGAPELLRTGLSPELNDRRSLGLAPRQGAEQRIRQQIDLARLQNAAADADEIAFAKLEPLQQSRKRDGWFRVGDLDRNAAIAGMLRRERRNLAPLSREAIGRAKLINAARGARDPYVVTDADLKTQVDNSDLLDPCIEVRLIRQRRKETMFANGSIKFGGYPGRRGPRKGVC